MASCFSSSGRAGRSAGPKHVHRKQEERFEVVTGRVRAHVDGEERSHGRGDVFAAPPGSVHTVWNDGGDDDVRLLVEFRPALRDRQKGIVLRAFAARAPVRSPGPYVACPVTSTIASCRATPGSTIPSCQVLAVVPRRS